MQFVYAKIDSQLEVEENDVGFIKNDKGKTIDIYFLRLKKEIEINKDIIVSFNIKETGDAFNYKVCDRCFKHLSTKDLYANNRHKKDNFITKRPSCKNCRKIKDGKAISTKDREKWNKERPKDYTPFTCPICKKTTIAGISKIVLDHCHKTGTVRGYVCESCNTGIGRFDDNELILNQAIHWLKEN